MEAWVQIPPLPALAPVLGDSVLVHGDSVQGRKAQVIFRMQVSVNSQKGLPLLLNCAFREWYGEGFLNIAVLVRQPFQNESTQVI